MFKYTGKQEWLNEALPEAMDNALDALKKCGLIIFSEVNQPMRWQKDDFESLAYFIDRYSVAIESIDEDKPEWAYIRLQNLEVDIDDYIKSFDAVWEDCDGIDDLAPEWCDRLEDHITDAVETFRERWERA